MSCSPRVIACDRHDSYHETLHGKQTYLIQLKSEGVGGVLGCSISYHNHKNLPLG